MTNLTAFDLKVQKHFWRSAIVYLIKDSQFFFQESRKMKYGFETDNLLGNRFGSSQKMNLKVILNVGIFHFCQNF